MDELAVKVGGKAAPPSAAVGRNANGRIVLDATSWERPAVTVRVELTPLQAARLAMELDEQAGDTLRNLPAYAYEIEQQGAAEVLP